MLAALERARETRAALPRRCLTRAADAADRAARQHRVPRGTGRTRRRSSPISSTTPRRLTRLADDLLALSREESAGALARRGRAARPGRLEAAAATRESSSIAPTPVTVRGDRAALERALANLVENARRHGPSGGRITVATPQAETASPGSPSPTRARLEPDEAEQAFERFWRGRADRAGPGSGWRSCAATASVTAVAPTPTAPVHDRASGSQRALRVDRLQRIGGARERIAVRSSRHTLDPRLLVLRSPSSLVAVGGGAAIAVAAGRRRPDAAGQAARPGDPRRARGAEAGRRHGAGHVHEQALPVRRAPRHRSGSALMSGASGRLWVTNDGRGRLELQSDAGDAQIVWNDDEVTVYDASSNTVYTHPDRFRPATAPARRHAAAVARRHRQVPGASSATHCDRLGGAAVRTSPGSRRTR